MPNRVAARSLLCFWAVRELGISAFVIATIGDPNRFESYKQVIRLAGLDLNAKRSSKRSDLAVPVISKRGDADLRYGLYQAALIASYCNEHFIKYYTRTLKAFDE